MDLELIKRREMIFAYAPLILWAGVIFFLSSNSGSMNETSRFVEPILRFLFPSAAAEEIKQYHGIVRKCAHFTEYAILAFFAVRAFAALARPFFGFLPYLLAFALVVIVASADEFNQSFEASRTSSSRDVLLDISGGVTMIALYFIFHRVFRRQALVAGRTHVSNS